MSNALIVLIIFVFAAGVLAILAVMIKSGHFLKSLFFSVCSGTGALLLIHFTSLITGFSLPVSVVSLALSAVGGAPSVLAAALFKLFA